jgi:hypothetical protein
MFIKSCFFQCTCCLLPSDLCDKIFKSSLFKNLDVKFPVTASKYSFKINI